jgi:hypothetical protein
VPEELKEWAQDTSLAIFAGMLLGGMYQWLEERRAGGRGGAVALFADFYERNIAGRRASSW